MNRRKGIIAVLAGACGAFIGDRAKAQDLRSSGSINYIHLDPPILQFNLDDYKPGTPVVRLSLGRRTVELTREDIMDALSEAPAQPEPPK